MTAERYGTEYAPMPETLKLLKSLWTDRRGVTAVEYAVVAAGIVAVASTAFNSLGTRLTNMINAIVAGH
jgi:Flp pilus assembly pilin Flp